MELYKDILAHFLASEDAHIIFPSLQLNAQQIVELRCYQALQRIKEIIVAFEDLGSNGGFRHDF